MDQLIKTALANLPLESRSVRLFHGRGKQFPLYENICIDLFNKTLLISLFKEVPEEWLDGIVSGFSEVQTNNILVQKRYLPGSPFSVLKGQVPEAECALEEGLKYHLKFEGSQNIGFFLDMYPGRKFLIKNAHQKSVLNLFSYTCSLSVAALFGGASFVVNVDMSKSALALGEKNHILNGLNKNVRFLPYDILTSWKRIITPGPYDIVVIDPPTYQGESFKVERDYYKIIKRLNQLTAQDATVLACLNAPYLTSQFVKDLFSLHAPEFEYCETIYSAFASMESIPEEGLKIVVFKKKKDL